MEYLITVFMLFLLVAICTLSYGIFDVAEGLNRALRCMEHIDRDIYESNELMKEIISMKKREKYIHLKKRLRNEVSELDGKDATQTEKPRQRADLP